MMIDDWAWHGIDGVKHYWAFGWRGKDDKR